LIWSADQFKNSGYVHKVATKAAKYKQSQRHFPQTARRLLLRAASGNIITNGAISGIAVGSFVTRLMLI
jgi:hypothetical protein